MVKLFILEVMIAYNSAWKQLFEICPLLYLLSIFSLIALVLMNYFN